MQDSLNQLRKSIYSPGPHQILAKEEIALFAEQCTIALASGGEGSRLSTATDQKQVHKTALRLPDGDTMIERTIRMYQEAGFRRFVCLVYRHAQSIQEILKDGSHLGVEIVYSYDPEKPVGRGGAIRNALENGSIPLNHHLIVHNPDDQIIHYSGSFPQDIVSGHLAGLNQHMLATAIVVAGTPYTYSAMKIENGIISQIEMYPYIPLPTHIGVTIFSPAVYTSFFELFDPMKKMDFEGVLFPSLAEKKQLYSHMIPDTCWLSVNDPKGLSQLCDIIRSEQNIA